MACADLTAVILSEQGSAALQQPITSIGCDVIHYLTMSQLQDSFFKQDACLALPGCYAHTWLVLIM